MSFPSDPPHDGQLGASLPAWSLSGDLGGDPSGAPGADPDTLPPAQGEAPRYALGNLLGEGGMGRVLVAEDRRLRRQVALKALAPGARGEAGRRRLEREAWITARLDHPGIVAVHDAGVLPDGLPFYTMRLVQGRSLADAAAEAPDLAARLSLVRPLLAACEAVAYAHQAGIVHRDLKPANILLGGFGETQVVDWGLARPVHEATDDWDLSPGGAPHQTRAGAVVGTPGYMAPEQARGEPADRRSDVYALGATLYTLLAGQGPRAGLSSDDAIEAARRGLGPRLAHAAPEAPPELVAIAERALHPDPDARYPDAGALAADLANWFEGRRVTAYDYSPAELARRLVAVWRTPLLALGVVLVVLALAITTSALRVAAERDRAVEAELASRAAEQEAREARARSDLALARALSQQARDATLAEDRASAEVLAAHSLTLVDSPAARGVLAAFGFAPRPERIDAFPPPPCARALLSDDGAELLCINPGGAALWRLDSPTPRWRREGDFVWGHASGGGRRVGLVERASAGYTLLLLDREGGEGWRSAPLTLSNLNGLSADRVLFQNSALLVLLDDEARVLTEHFPCASSMSAATLHPDGRTVYAFCVDGGLVIGDDPARPVQRLPTPLVARREPSAAVVLADRVVAATHRGELASIDPVTGAVAPLVDSGLGLIRVLRASPDGRRVAMLGERGGARIWEPETGLWVATLPTSGLVDLAWQADDELLTLGDELVRWRVPTRPTALRVSCGAGVASLDLSPAGDLMALALGGGELRVVPLSGAPARRMQTYSPEVAKATSFSLDGRHVATTSRRSPALALYDLLHDRVLHPADGEPYRRLVFLASGRLMGLTYGKSLVLRAPPDFTRNAGQVDLAVPVIDAGGSPSGRWVAVLDEAARVHLFDDEATEIVHAFDAPGTVAVDVFPDGRRLALASDQGVALTDLDGRVTLRIDAPGAGHRDLAVSSDGALVAAGGLDTTVRVWDTTTGRLVAELRGHEGRVSALQFSPVEPLLVSGSWDETARIWDLRRLDAPPEALLAEITAAWGLGLEAAQAR